MFVLVTCILVAAIGPRDGKTKPAMKDYMPLHGQRKLKFACSVDVDDPNKSPQKYCASSCKPKDRTWDSSSTISPIGMHWCWTKDRNFKTAMVSGKQSRVDPNKRMKCTTDDDCKKNIRNQKEGSIAYWRCLSTQGSGRIIDDYMDCQTMEELGE